MDDLRVCFIGDSFVAGVGDPEHLGWTGRLAARSSRAGRPLTAYNLGVRRQTSRDITKRWLLECEQRLPETADSRVVFSFGVNDIIDDGAGPRVHADESVEHLTGMLQKAAGRGWTALVVGPPPVADADARPAARASGRSVPTLLPRGSRAVRRHLRAAALRRGVAH